MNKIDTGPWYEEAAFEDVYESVFEAACKKEAAYMEETVIKLQMVSNCEAGPHGELASK